MDKNFLITNIFQKEIKFCQVHTIWCFNPFLHEFCFSPVIKRQPKIGSCRLPTHERRAHRNFFIIHSYFKIEIFSIRTLYWPLCNNSLNKYFFKVGSPVQPLGGRGPPGPQRQAPRATLRPSSASPVRRGPYPHQGHLQNCRYPLQVRVSIIGG